MTPLDSLRGFIFCVEHGHSFKNGACVRCNAKAGGKTLGDLLVEAMDVKQGKKNSKGKAS